MVDDASTQDLAAATEVFQQCRRRLFGIAYRMLGTVADAEDILQEVWIRWQTTDRTSVLEPAAFLSTVTTRLSINVLQSAHTRRETYIGPWLPEPVNTEDDPSLGAERGEALQYAILILLEKLTPTERAAYVLREALDYPYDRIADILQTTSASARQLLSRARKHLASERRIAASRTSSAASWKHSSPPRRRATPSELEALFAADVTSLTDGNGAKLAARIPVIGSTRVAKFVAAFSSHFWAGKAVDWVEVNGQPAVTLSENGVVTTLLTLTSSPGGITSPSLGHEPGQAPPRRDCRSMTSWRLVLRRRRDARRRTVTRRARRRPSEPSSMRCGSASAARIAHLLSARRDTDHRRRRACRRPPRHRSLGDGGDRPGAAVRSSTPFPTRMLVKHEVNGAPGIVVRSHDRVVGVVSIAMGRARSPSIWAVTNPDKLAHWNRT